MIVPRILVRSYLQQMLQTALAEDLDDRVFVGRPNPVMREDLPCVLILPISETIVKQGGSDYMPLGYDRIMSCTLMVVMEHPRDPSGGLNIEDRLDIVGRKIENAVKEDRRFQKDLPGWAGNPGDDGVLGGSRLISVDVDLDNESESNIAVMQLVFEFLYEDLSYNEKRSQTFESFLIELRRVGWDETTVDPVLIAAEGDVND